jgi:hypothetical protein
LYWHSVLCLSKTRNLTELCGCDETGKHKGLKHLRRNACGFDSHHPHMEKSKLTIFSNGTLCLIKDKLFDCPEVIGIKEINGDLQFKTRK